jgi:hypothetical protein
MTTTEQMQAAMSALDEAFNGDAQGTDRKVGIVLLTFPFGVVENGQVNYIGNGDRDTVRVALKELLARWEGRWARQRTFDPCSGNQK